MESSDPKPKDSTENCMKFIPQRSVLKEENDAIKSVFSQCTSLINNLKQLRQVMRKYGKSKQEAVFQLTSDFEGEVFSLNDMASSLDSIYLPPELSGFINYGLKKVQEDSSIKENEGNQSEKPKGDSSIPTENSLKLFHEDLHDRVLYSTQLGRGANKSFKKMESKLKSKIKDFLKKTFDKPE